MKRPRKLFAVFNPGAANGRARRWLGDIRAGLERAGFDATLEVTEHAGHGTELVRGASVERFDAIAAIGGDGTLFETLNGLMLHAPNRRPPLGLIPLGTGNAFSRDIGLAPDQWREGIELIARGTTRKVDVGRLECRGFAGFFLNIAGIGFVTRVGRTSARLKVTGRMAYTLGTLRHCLFLRSHPLELEIDGHAIRQDSLFLEVANSRFTGTSFQIAPAARIDDGWLDMVLVRRLSRRRLLRLFPTIYSGRHVEHEEVTTLQGREIVIHGPGGLEFTVDGEFCGATPARIRCLPAAIEIFAA